MKPALPAQRIVLSFALAAAVYAASSLPVDPQRYLNDIHFLASEELRGRGNGTPELEKAADYIAQQFKSIGLKPPVGKSYFQEFSVTIRATLGAGNRFQITEDGAHKTLQLEEDFVPFNFSSSGKIPPGQVVFAGYGITAKEYNYDDYAGLDVKDKLVLILRHEPQEFDESSVFAGKVYTLHAQFPSKATNARLHGARGVILVSDVANHPSDGAKLEKFGTTVGPANAGLPFVQMKADVAEDWFRRAGKNMLEVEAAIDKDLKPRSFAFPDSIGVDLDVDVEREQKKIRNVVGYLPGTTPEHVIVGAHYDHLGLGEQFSLAPSEAGKPHVGADDNASGTAGVIELARSLAGRGKQKRGILFMTFAGEELGLLGSNYYVNQPLLPIHDAVAMINMDMIGRIRDGKVFVGGSGTGSTFKALMDEERSRTDLKLEFSEQGGYGSSDHTSFTTKQVPILFFFSGLHADYHKPSDTWDKINGADAAKLLNVIADLTGKLASAADRPEYIRVAEPPNSHSSGGGGGYGPYFGSIPDFTELPDGVRFSDIRDGSPAAKAGLKGGDILVEFDGKEIKNLYDYTYALRARKPGDTVEVKVLRGAGTLAVKVTLAERR